MVEELKKQVSEMLDVIERNYELSKTLESLIEKYSSLLSTTSKTISDIRVYREGWKEIEQCLRQSCNIKVEERGDNVFVYLSDVPISLFAGRTIPKAELSNATQIIRDEIIRSFPSYLTSTSRFIVDVLTNLLDDITQTSYKLNDALREIEKVKGSIKDLFKDEFEKIKTLNSEIIKEIEKLREEIIEFRNEFRYEMDELKNSQDLEQ
ncbi:MAG: hypothetical protein QXQ91_03415 [Nanopusillaceae archaeon]